MRESGDQRSQIAFRGSVHCLWCSIVLGEQLQRAVAASRTSTKLGGPLAPETLNSAARQSETRGSSRPQVAALDGGRQQQQQQQQQQPRQQHSPHFAAHECALRMPAGPQSTAPATSNCTKSLFQQGLLIFPAGAGNRVLLWVNSSAPHRGSTLKPATPCTPRTARRLPDQPQHPARARQRRVASSTLTLRDCGYSVQGGSVLGFGDYCLWCRCAC